MAFAVAAAAVVALAFTAAFGVSVAQERFGQRLLAAAPTMKRWGGVALIIVGAWFIILGIFASGFASLFPV